MTAPARWRYGAGTGPDPMENVVKLAANISLILLGIVAVTASLHYAQIVVAPVVMAVVIGLMFGPVADRMERMGLPPGVSAALVAVAFIFIAAATLASIAVPLSEWSRYLPIIWDRLQDIVANWRDALAAIDDLQDNLRTAAGKVGQMEVQVDQGSPVENVALLAPAILMQLILFLVSLYFFVATRHDIRASILALCFDRRLRWRVAHIFRDVEAMVSRYLLSITAVNIGLGVAVAIAMWMLGVPSPFLWGILAGVLNYIVYVGPAAMTAILFCVGLATGDNAWAWLAPPIVYLCLNAIESQLVTPQVIGRAVTLNPFLVFLAIGFWLWVWGPVGGFVAVPVLLIMAAIVRRIIPGIPQRHVMLSKRARREKSLEPISR